ncbi:SGNH/GDSL hydrolase family protein [Bacillus aerolatus]|uniref:SGNH/GDSL hydrolase family protein n=1 Tax=Bacillus aerolatus TaxID=2653354 RepID=A0A6I1FR30_9BACI|nr:GDSL-type esterase/lipase family protein [Bacillus aerolatus]KAB7704242.1 SGNH/GDSL hydrolase family protein [Bacillus aerolatus]
MYRIHQYQQGELEAPADPVVDEEKTGFIAFGDSNTSGSYFKDQYPEYQNNKWTDQVAAEYSKGMETDVYNAGVSGDETNEGMARFKKEVLDLNPSAVSIMFGLNDALLLSNGQPQVSKAQFEKNIKSMVTQLKAKDVKILLMTNPPVNEELYYNFYSTKNLKQLYADKGGIRKWTNSYNDIVRKVAKDQKVQLIDNYANAIAKAGSETDSAISKSGLVDNLIGLHWSPKGNSMIAYSVKYYLSK